MRFSVDSATAHLIRTNGIRRRTECVSIRFLPGDDYRYSPVVSKKQGTSVRRNRLKRVIREIMRAGSGNFPTGSYLIYYNGASVNVAFRPLEEAIVHAIRELRNRRDV